MPAKIIANSQLVSTPECVDHMKCCYQDGIMKGIYLGSFLGMSLVATLYVVCNILLGIK